MPAPEDLVDPEVEDNDLVGQWHEHPVTRKFVQNVRDGLESAKLVFDAACRDTSDPRVAKAYSLVTTLKKVLEDTGA